MSSKKTQEIVLENYPQLLAELQAHVTKTHTTLAEIVTRQKVEMAWKIGESVDKYLSKNEQTNSYGKYLFEKLEGDLGISRSVLYKMQRFYQTYPQLPQDNSKLNWSHYRILSGVSKASERKRLEGFVQENSWDSHELQREVKKTKIAQIQQQSHSKPKPEKQTKLTPRRGKLFSYNLVKFKGDENFKIDCGFDIFRDVEEALPAGDVAVIETVKESRNYVLKKSTTPTQKLHTYKARLDRVVDGDTLYVILDLGFKTFHREKLRLRGIDAPELETVEGAKSTAALKNILKTTPFLVVKTSAVDVYGRYVCDVFLPENSNETDAQKVADSGIFLNQLLLDKGLAAQV
ncbi:MAG: thermonuclease family protein [Rickettsiales bacterium]|nr:thermonuclease family protein [Rickettsiales bacterium]